MFASLACVVRRGLLLCVLACLGLAQAPLTWAEQSAAESDKPAAAPAEHDIAGSWQGTLKLGPGLRIVFNIERDKEGGYRAKLDSPDQGSKGIPVAKLSREGNEVIADVKVIAGNFTGTLAEDGKTIKGTWKQGGQEFPLELTRLDKEPDYRRPQDPQKPYPYREEQVTIKNETAGIKLAGTLTLPAGDKPAPAVVLLSGSGPQDRDEALMGHRPFLVLADALTRRGIAVLRCDDRGVGGTGGSTFESTTPELAADALAAVAYLKSRPEIDSQHVGLIGHSEGGLVAPMAASQSKDVAFIVMMAGTGVPGNEILDRQGELIARASGAGDKQIAEQRAAQQQIFPILKEETDPKKIEERLRAVLDQQAGKDGLSESQKATADANLKLLLTPWFRYFITHDPRPVLKKVQCPVLAIVGEKDVQVDPEQNMPPIEQALTEAGNKDSTFRIFPGLNHLFQHSETGALAEYGKIEETISPEVLTFIADWISERAK